MLTAALVAVEGDGGCPVTAAPGGASPPGEPPHAISKNSISRLKAAGEWGILFRVPLERYSEGKGRIDL